MYKRQVVLWIISMWRRGGQYTGKMHRLLALVGVVFWLGAYVLLTNLAIDKRVVSNYFGNIAFAYEDYGFPYCFTASIFNTGISKRSGYSEENLSLIHISTGRMYPGQTAAILVWVCLW